MTDLMGAKVAQKTTGRAVAKFKLRRDRPMNADCLGV